MPKSINLKQRLQRAYDQFYYMCPFILMSPGERLFLVFVLTSIFSLIIFSTYKSIVNIHALALNFGAYSSIARLFKEVSTEFKIIKSPLMDQILTEYDSVGSINSSSSSVGFLN